MAQASPSFVPFWDSKNMAVSMWWRGSTSNLLAIASAVFVCIALLIVGRYLSPIVVSACLLAVSAHVALISGLALYRFVRLQNRKLTFLNIGLRYLPPP